MFWRRFWFLVLSRVVRGFASALIVFCYVYDVRGGGLLRLLTRIPDLWVAR